MAKPNSGEGETMSEMVGYETRSVGKAVQGSDVVEFNPEAVADATLQGLEYLGGDRESRFSDPKDARTFGAEEPKNDHRKAA